MDVFYVWYNVWEILVQRKMWIMNVMCNMCACYAGENVCSHDNGGCSHLCIYRPAGKSPVCLCPRNMRLQVDNRTCVIPDAYLLYSRHDDIRRVSLGDSVIANDEFVVETGTRSVSAIDCLVTDSRVFWTDSSEKVADPCC